MIDRYECIEPFLALLDAVKSSSSDFTRRSFPGQILSVDFVDRQTVTPAAYSGELNLRSLAARESVRHRGRAHSGALSADRDSVRRHRLVLRKTQQRNLRCDAATV